ncbi:hypothetical protein KP509_28G021100 [Ceratopteris richardii]|uniref:WRKY domain-containing protein n=1 Tax=Ceratopteris richardii TaxID=49495 RepID=A0A8T2RC23_CERRI|nr:hypothetical protein KP509_28G021100 [Ceratopteris richardii]
MSFRASEAEFISDLSFIFQNNSQVSTHTPVHSYAPIPPETRTSVARNQSSVVGLNPYDTSIIDPYQVPPVTLWSSVMQDPAFHQVQNHEHHICVEPNLPLCLPSTQAPACWERHIADPGVGPIRRNGSFNAARISFAASQDVATTSSHLPLFYATPHTADSQLGSSYSTGFPSAAIASSRIHQDEFNTRTYLPAFYGHRHAASSEHRADYGYGVHGSRMPSSHTVPHPIPSSNEQHFAFTNMSPPLIHEDAVGRESLLHEPSTRRDQIEENSISVQNCPPNLSDGYVWLKYGQKNRRNHPYPRSYFRCAVKNCNVKKRIQKEVGSVTFTYVGRHNHPNSST